MKILSLLFLVTAVSAQAQAQPASLQKFDCKIDPEASAKVFSDRYRSQIAYTQSRKKRRIGEDEGVIASLMTNAVQAGIAKNAKGTFQFAIDTEKNEIKSAKIHAWGFSKQMDKFGADSIQALPSYKAAMDKMKDANATPELIEAVENEVAKLPAAKKWKAGEEKSDFPEIKKSRVLYPSKPKDQEEIGHLFGHRDDIEFVSSTAYGNFIVKKPDGGTYTLDFTDFEMKCSKPGAKAETEKEEPGTKEAN
ncbi:MAG: hypothetical protein ACXWQO_08620 [Bdellovibrionota bacterium]